MLYMEFLLMLLQQMQQYILYLLFLLLKQLVQIMLHIQHFLLKMHQPSSQTLYYHLMLNPFVDLIHFSLIHILMSYKVLHLFFQVLQFYLLNLATKSCLLLLCLPKTNHLFVLIEQILLYSLLYLHYTHILPLLVHIDLCHFALLILQSLLCLPLALL